jgi:HTH-type transcriptional regulator/antitoxin HigA
MDEMGLTTTSPPAALNPARYGRLCATLVPKIIESDEEFDRMVERMEELDRKKNPGPEEEALSALLARLIEDYDDRIAVLADVPPYTVVLHLMEQKGLRQADLLPVFGSCSVASDALSGKREFSKVHIRKLAEFFHLSPAAFF